MACKIRVLDEKTINQIAAGEVIENPASVIKELVDNSLDSGASKIVIEAQGSGRQLIVVQDNGSGMGPDDALLCLERHATSKIRTFDDLFLLSTMGFRGEALASIASVSDLSILTAINDSQEEESLLDGTSISASGGKIISCCSTRCFGGTRVEVKSLFHNVPARRKFQKSPVKDASDIIKTTSLLALANPKVAFELILNQKKELHLLPSTDDSFSDRIKLVLGQEFFSDLLPINYSSDKISLSGFIGKPSASKPTRTGQYLFVNGRPVSSPLLSHVIKEAYGTSIEPNRHPIFVLYAKTRTDFIDVNVHPQKKEIRFHTEEAIENACGEAISITLFKVPTAPVFSKENHTLRPVSYAPPSFQYESNFAFKEKPLQLQQQKLPGMENQFRVVGTIWHYIFVDIRSVDERFKNLSNDENTLYLIDSKLALSRIIFETVQSAKESVQTLLTPVFIELSAAESAQLLEKLDALKAMGMNIYEFGINAFLVDAIPSSFENVDIVEWIHSILLDREEGIDMPRAAMLASRMQKMSYPLSNEFSLELIKKLLSCKDPFTCPSGLPVISFFTKIELMKKFQM